MLTGENRRLKLTVVGETGPKSASDEINNYMSMIFQEAAGFV